MANEGIQFIISANDKASEVLEGLNGKLQAMDKGLKIVGGTMLATGAAITASLGLSIKSFAETGDEIQKMSIRTGVSTEALSALKYAADMSGTSLGGLESSIKLMQRGIYDASQGTGTMVDALKKLNIPVGVLKGMKPEDQFMKLASAIAEIQDPTVRAAMAVEVFGRSGTDLLPMLADGKEGLTKMKDEAAKLGLIFDQEAADKAAKFNDALTTLKGGMTGIQMTIAENLIPVLMPLIEKVQIILENIMDWIKANPELFRTLAIVTGGVGALLIPLGTLLIILPQLVAGFIAVRTLLLVQMIPTIVAFVTALWAQVTATLAALASTGALIPVALAAVAAIAGITFAVSELVKQQQSQIDLTIKATEVTEALSKANVSITDTTGLLTAKNYRLAESYGAIRRGAVMSASSMQTYIQALVASGQILPSEAHEVGIGIQAGTYEPAPWRPPEEFQYGGIVPGPSGAPTHIIAHGGEMFLGAGNQLPIIIENNIYLDGEPIVRSVVKRLTKEVRLQGGI